NKAISVAANRNATIVIGEGDYRETLDFDQLISGSIRFVAQRNAKVRILGSQKLSFTKTSGYSNIYEAPFSASLLSRRIIYEDGRPSKPIMPDERHALQKGLLFRLPFTHIIEKTLSTDLVTT